MHGGFVHHIDPVLFTVGGVHLWWYGAGFAAGFLTLHRFALRERARLGLTRNDVWALSLVMTIGTLAGGRLVQVLFDEWPFYSAHPVFLPVFWLGGMATHGLLAGSAVAAAGFAWWWRVPFLTLADALVVPGAVLLGTGRLGNFIDGQIVGRATDVWWAVQFPYAEGFRHPVVLYDGVKNLVLAGYLWRVRRTATTPGAVAARFVFWYAAPRVLIDLFRDYPSHRLELGTGQTLNIAMAALGAVLLVRSRWRRLGRLRTQFGPRPVPVPPVDLAPSPVRRVAFGLALAACLTMPSNWTQDVPRRYGDRHPGLTHSWLYPLLTWSPPP